MLTFRELQIHNDVWAWKQTREQQAAIALAWTTAGLHRAKKMPKIDVMLKKVEQHSAPPTDDDVAETKRIAEEAEQDLLKKRALRAATGKA